MHLIEPVAQGPVLTEEQLQQEHQLPPEQAEAVRLMLEPIVAYQGMVQMHDQMAELSQHTQVAMVGLERLKSDLVAYQRAKHKGAANES